MTRKSLIITALSLLACCHLRSAEPERQPPLFSGVAIGADIVGPVMQAAGSDWSQLEAFARIGLHDRFFPICELGLGRCDHEGRELDNRCSLTAPYIRLGMDYNMVHLHEGNRLMLGLRYGFSRYDYDLDSPVPLTDPYWGESRPYREHSLAGSAHWAEVCIGLETRLVSFVSVGWDMRFKLKVSQHASEHGLPWYIPGYGRNADGVGWGGTFKIMFAI